MLTAEDLYFYSASSSMMKQSVDGIIVLVYI